jgi:hypothetical protein
MNVSDLLLLVGGFILLICTIATILEENRAA